MSIAVIGVIAVVVVAFIAFERSGGASVGVIRKCLEDGALVVDVRTPREFDAGHLAQAVNIPLSMVGEEVPRRVVDKARPLLLHCASGGRSSVARRMLMQQGYTRVYNLGSYARAARILEQASTGAAQ